MHPTACAKKDFYEGVKGLDGGVCRNEQIDYVKLLMQARRTVVGHAPLVGRLPVSGGCERHS